MTRDLRIFYAAGGGDIIGTYRCWSRGEDDPTEVALTYSRQFFDVCRELNATTLVVGAHPRRERACSDDGVFTLVHKPIPFRRSGGLLYHIGQLWYGFHLTLAALRFRANVAVISEGGHWFQYSLLSMLGVAVVPDLHSVLWPKYRPLSRAGRIIRRLNRGFFRRRCAAVLSLSDDITQQVREQAAGSPRPIVAFLPVFRASLFQGVKPATHDDRPFRVLFAGRIERSKGVFDLLEIAKDFASAGHTDVEFDLCGTGASLDELKFAARDAGLEDRFRCHGHCDQQKMRRMYERCHVVIVPTRAELVEGFNKVVVEAVLAGRPVVTSAVCPALGYVKDAAAEVAPNDVAGYAAAILRLRDDSEYYHELVRHCALIGARFLDVSAGWGAALRRVLLAVREGREVTPVTAAAATATAPVVSTESEPAAMAVGALR